MSYTESNGLQQSLFSRVAPDDKRHDFWIGTSGFSYEDWTDTVYPMNLPKRKWFDFYTTLFNTLELNMSFYRVPSRQVIESFFKRTTPDFLLTLKAHKSMTHEYKSDYIGAFLEYSRLSEEFNRPFQILFQFPYSFHYTSGNFNYLKTLVIRFNCSKAVEFRNSGWMRDEVFQWAIKENITVVSVDEPHLNGLMPSELFETNGIYIRFHGRNAAKWWEHERAYERYDYLYQKDELMEWINKIRIIPSKPAVFYFNNHYKGQAVKNARLFAELLENRKG
ncbi:MAG TPA: DUF72 domain-containing protein [Thermotogota bacterium]|nr:DUF72 domain-containing protein [Thermotogota bacterium]HPJ87978.1 DUF72 domain-containing protein [Thermotogota bacterium]HPR95065.1 DUF72 domain-containing protein [Thermotogota bacterium]